MRINKDSLQARVKNLANKKKVPSNTILQDYFFDAFLRRLSKSKYIKNFVFKGGFLLSTDLGIDFRSTMDIDFLLRNLAFEKESIKNIFKEIKDIDADDNVTFDFREITKIREEDVYGGYNVSLLGKLENIKVPVSIDVATGDPITPSSITYRYKCLFDDSFIEFPSYNFETIVAEKLQTILYRGTANSRSKDYYDIYIINKLRIDDINPNHLRAAFNNTCEHRGTTFTKEEVLEIVQTIETSKTIQDRWARYTEKNAFASKIPFSEIAEALRFFVNMVV